MTADKTPELGCYGDGAFGHQHTRERCADLLAAYARDYMDRGERVPRAPSGRTALELFDLLTMGEASDDAAEETDACEWLDEHTQAPGAWWGWQDGDFGLWTDEHRVHGERGCARPSGESFTCPGCDRVCCWCFGCADESENICDDCYMQKNRHTERTGSTHE